MRPGLRNKNNFGVMEYWSAAKSQKAFQHFFQYSNTPSLQHTIFDYPPDCVRLTIISLVIKRTQIRAIFALCGQ